MKRSAKTPTDDGLRLLYATRRAHDALFDASEALVAAEKSLCDAVDAMKRAEIDRFMLGDASLGINDAASTIDSALSSVRSILGHYAKRIGNEAGGKR